MSRHDEDYIEAETGQFLNADLPNPAGVSTRAGTVSTNITIPTDSEIPPTATNIQNDNSLPSDESVVSKVLRQSAHPTVAIIHVAFKLVAIASYLLLGLFTRNFVIQFVVTTTILAFDFWIVKNVTGRLLVGLRWWHEIAEDGVTQQWRFETIPERDHLNVVDGRIFWWTLYAFPIVWIFLGLICILKFNISHLIMVIIALVLSAANIIGYYKCSQDATEQIKNYIGKTVIGHAMERSGFGRLSQYL